MKALVTGAAGFIGSHLAEALRAAGHAVAGVDAFTPYYDPRIKRANVEAVRAGGAFDLTEGDLRAVPLRDLLAGVDVVFHLAGQPGVLSFGPNFPDYVELNLMATHHLLEAARACRKPPHLVLASSSSVYGDGARPFREDGETRPLNPYGITKLAAESLCRQYHAQGWVPVTAFRFFTVYGERQRPDMAFHRLCLAALRGGTFTIRGTGEQVRDFTNVADVARVLVAAADRPAAGRVYNLGGGHTVTLNGAIALLERVAGTAIRVVRAPQEAGEMAATEADTSALQAAFGFTPSVPLEEGLRRQFAWIKDHARLLS